MSSPSSSSSPAPGYSLAQRLLAAACGAVCHLLFGLAILAMAIALFNGLRIGLGPFSGWAAAAVNLLLLASFPFAHSWLLSSRGRRLMEHLVPLGIGKELSTTVFAALSSAQLLAVFLLWSPSGIVWWEASGGFKWLLGAVAATAWIALAKSMYDAQFSLQTGFLGWSAVAWNRAPAYRPFATQGVYRYVRQPIYISFAFILWLASSWTPDQVVLAALWSGYCVVGSLQKEKRYLRYFGDAYRQYQARVSFWLPASRRPAGTSAPTAETDAPRDADVIIAGAGPVGLLLANLLGRRGVRVLITERRTRPPEGSMAIGITPPSLAILKDLALDRAFVDCGVPIDTARVFENGTLLGDVDFSRLPAEHRFILSLPQATTVALLRDHLRNCPSVRVMDGVEFVAEESTPEGVQVRLRDTDNGAYSEHSAAYLVGCDGHRSRVRREADIRSRSHAYRVRFLMADFEDDTTLGDEAHLYFGRKGSVESFPLPDGQRRWIVLAKNGDGNREDIATAVTRRVAERTGFDLSGSRVLFESAFQPRRSLAKTYMRGRALLCGDAAHVMSPIGGQGMNTGFADAAHLDRALSLALERPDEAAKAFAGYRADRRRAFKVAADRAAAGMWLGTRRGFLFSALRRVFIGQVLLRSSVRDQLAPYFAMLTIPGVHSPTKQPLPAGRNV